MARKNCKNGRKTTSFKNVILLDTIFATDKKTTHYKQELFSKVFAVKDVRMGSKGYESIHISFSTNHVDFYVFFSMTEARRSLWTLRPMSVVSTDNKVVSTVLA
eukprot:scaffold17459_cov54-Attheya_sp.AAC.2